MTSGAIQAYVPAALILVVWCHSRARPKSVIFKVFPLKLTLSSGSRMRTEEEQNNEQRPCLPAKSSLDKSQVGHTEAIVKGGG